jgi:hypothetical protein
MGYLQRNDLEEVFFRVQRKWTNFPETSRKASVSWGMMGAYSRNTEGTRLRGYLNLTRDEKLRSGADRDLMVRIVPAGYDDLISRGHGTVWLEQNLEIKASYTTPREGAWRKSLKVQVFQEGLDDWAVEFEGNVTWYPSDQLNFDVKVKPVWSNDWLIWMQDTQFGQFSRQKVTGEISSNWFPFEGHELRLRAQWIAIDAVAKQSYGIGDEGRLVPDTEPLEDFAALNFGFQIRYRWEIAPMSDLYLVYSRGGMDRFENPEGSTWDLLRDSSSLRDSDQVLVKLKYKF